MFLYEIVMEYHKRKWSEPIDEELVVAIRKIKSIERKMIKPKKAQIVGEVFKYALVGVVSIVILLAGYKMIDIVKERACKTEIAKFEIDLKNIDKSLRFGTKELQSYDAPCKVDEIYFFDLSKNINPEDFEKSPIIKDTLKNKGNNNIFLVKKGEVKRTFYAGNLEIVYPYYTCFIPRFDKMAFFAEGFGKSVKISSACDQPECTYIPINISEDEAKKIIREAIEFQCQYCPKDFNQEAEFAKLTSRNIELFRKFTYCDDITTVEIIIKPKKGQEVKDFKFYEFIPKTCIDDLKKYLFENIEDSEGEVNLKYDPLILWHFSDLGSEKKISYKLRGALDDECRRAILGFGVAQFVEAKKKIEEAQKNTPPTISGLPEVKLFDVKLHKNVLPNLWNYARDKETDLRKLVYTIVDQTNSDLVDCFITNEKHVDCEVKQNKEGSSLVTVQVYDSEFTDKANFNVRVMQTCQKHAKIGCAGDSIVWLDSCGKQEEFIKACGLDESCESGECKKVTKEQPPAKKCTKSRDCSGYPFVWCKNDRCCFLGLC